MTADGKSIVPNFTVGRKAYGNVCFGEPIDISGLNLDELVHFRKEVIIYHWIMDGHMMKQCAKPSKAVNVLTR